MAPGTHTELRTGCRRGNTAALDALLYGCADDVYSLALAAMSDEQQAEECLRETWRRLLRALARLRFGAVPHHEVRRIAYRVVAERVGGPAARAARLAVTGSDGTMRLAGVQTPEEVLSELAALSAERAPTLQTHRRRRRLMLTGTVVTLFVITVGVWSAVLYQRSQQSGDLARLQYRCLRQRVIEHELAGAMRVAAGQLEDPMGEDREVAANCERIILVLEEIGNNDRLVTVSGLRYIKQRIARNQLADVSRSLPRDSAELQRSLPRITLALDEVGNL